MLHVRTSEGDARVNPDAVMDDRLRMDDHAKSAVQQQKITPDLHPQGDFRAEKFQNEVGEFPKYR
jgi:hypothetical protein